jgi:hypothetical protein
MSNEGESNILGMLTHLTAEVAAPRNEVAMDGRVKLLEALTNSVEIVEIKVGRVHANMHDVKMRLDASVASVAATFHVQNSLTDRLDVQLALVEKRPGLRDAGMG